MHAGATPDTAYRRRRVMRLQSLHEFLDIQIDHRETLLEVPITSTVWILYVRSNWMRPETQHCDAYRASDPLLHQLQLLRPLKHHNQVSLQYERCLHSRRPMVLQSDPTV